MISIGNDIKQSLGDIPAIIYTLIHKAFYEVEAEFVFT